MTRVASITTTAAERDLTTIIMTEMIKMTEAAIGTAADPAIVISTRGRQRESCQSRRQEVFSNKTRSGNSSLKSPIAWDSISKRVLVPDNSEVPADASVSTQDPTTVLVPQVPAWTLAKF